MGVDLEDAIAGEEQNEEDSSMKLKMIVCGKQYREGWKHLC